MKKRLIILSGIVLIVIIFFFVRMTYSIDEKNDPRFPDKNFYQCVISHLKETDYDINGVISNDALINLTTLDCSHKNIQSVKGLELLT